MAATDTVTDPVEPIGTGNGHDRDNRGGTRLPAWLSVLYLVLGAVGIIASGVITVDKIRLAEDSSFSTACDLNAVLSCTGVMSSAQAEAFGFPNPIIGLVGFAVVMGIGAACLAGARMTGWFYFGLQLGMLFAIGFVHWLFFQAVFRIELLCLYCICVWVVVVILFVVTTFFNLTSFSGSPAMTKLMRWSIPVIIVWLALIAAAVFINLGDQIF